MIIFKKLRLQDEKQYENLYEIRVKGDVKKEIEMGNWVVRILNMSIFLKLKLLYL